MLPNVAARLSGLEQKGTHAHVPTQRVSDAAVVTTLLSATVPC